MDQYWPFAIARPIGSVTGQSAKTVTVTDEELDWTGPHRNSTDCGDHFSPYGDPTLH